MGSLKIGFTLSSNSVLSSPINVTASSSVVADSGVLVRAKVLKTAVDADALVVYKADDKLVSGYLYVKNLEAEKESYVYIYNDTDSDALVAKIAGGEFCFIPVAVNKTYKVYSTRVDSLVDYAVFGLDSSAVTLS
tara:strand:+ start:1072 stop:1476 length:405 start_codon:yes stop_codon:yes gene_type:complete